MKNNTETATAAQPVHRRRNKRVEYILAIYRQEHPGEAIEPHLVSPWAIKRGLDKRPPLTREEMLRRDISRQLKNEYFIDPQGREVRASHAIPIEVLTPKGPKRYSRWLPLFDAPPDHMRISAQLRRKSAFADVRQLALDLDSYNDNNHFKALIPIPSFDFNRDIEDSKQSTIYKEDPDDDGDD